MLGTELKTKWIAGLRSGDYKQGTGLLFSDGKHCCLGVLAVVADLAVACNLDCKPRYDQGETYRPLHDLIGLDETAKLIVLNDLERKTFPEIADYVERYL